MIIEGNVLGLRIARCRDMIDIKSLKPDQALHDPSLCCSAKPVSPIFRLRVSLTILVLLCGSLFLFVHLFAVEDIRDDPLVHEHFDVSEVYLPSTV